MPKCIVQGCPIKHALFNLPNEKPRYCKKHSTKDMVDVKNPKCKKCTLRPKYNFESESKGICCAEHKEDSIVDVVSPKCKKCIKRPYYNFKNEKKGIYCAEHKEDSMIDVVNSRCKKCTKQPYYNFEGEKKGIYCTEHKEDGMVDVISPRCKKCTKQPTYNFEANKKGIYCVTHKEDGMIDVISSRCLKCTKLPTYNLEGEKKAIYCTEHKEDYMVDVINKRCIECSITRVSNEKYRNHCLRCFIYKFPEEPITRQYKIKENHIIDFIKENFKNEQVFFDKTIGGCSKRRPDAFIDKLTHVIIIECDENQHCGKEYTNCDTKRTMELFQDFNSRPMVFIRFNPDAYTDKGKKIGSCFNIHKSWDVPVKNEKELSSRLSKLQETMNQWLIQIPEREITYEYLFYDIN